MTNSDISYFNGSKLALAIILSISLVFVGLKPTPSYARGEGAALGAILLLGVFACASDPKCSGRNGRKNGGGKGPKPGYSGYRDAAAMTQQQKVYLQQGLQSRGYYSGTIDGLIGAGTRNSIKNYQAGAGQSQTGRLTGQQMNDLIAAAPYFAVMSPGDPMLFHSDVASDLDKNGVRSLQTALNAIGLNAGPVDGSWGGKTRSAVDAYKRNNALPSTPLATRRLLAHVEGRDYAVFRPGDETAPGGPEALAPGEQGDAVVVVEPADSEPGIDADVAPLNVVNFEVAGLRVGIVPSEFAEILEEQLETELVFDEAFGTTFGGAGIFSMAQQATSSHWPAQDTVASTDQIVAVYDETLPEFGALAIFRTILLPESVTRDTFDAHIVPSLIETYGTTGKVSDALIWIGNSEALESAELSRGALASCGNLQISSVEDTMPAAESIWSNSAGTMLNTASLSSVTRACGDVLSVDFIDGSIRISLWNSDFILERQSVGKADAGDVELMPKIKF